MKLKIDTADDFFDHVALVERHQPGHPLLAQLEKYTPMAVIYLKHALKGIDTKARPQVQNKVKEQSPPDTAEWVALQKKASSLYARRCNLSNQFHLKPNDRIHCANISDEIRQIQRKYGKVQRQIAHYRRTGQLLEEAEEVERVYEGVALSRRIRTVQQNIRRNRSVILREGASMDKARLAKTEKKLKEYERELESLERQLGQESL